MGVYVHQPLQTEIFTATCAQIMEADSEEGRLLLLWGRMSRNLISNSESKETQL